MPARSTAPLPKMMATAPAETQQRSKVRLPAYRGQGTSDAYHAQACLAAQVQGWPPAETTTQVLLSLEGKGLKILDDLPPHVLSEWDKVQGMLQRSFREHTHPEEASEELALRRYGEKEQLDAFLVYPNFTADVKEGMTLWGASCGASVVERAQISASGVEGRGISLPTTRLQRRWTPYASIGLWTSYPISCRWTPYPSSCR